MESESEKFYRRANTVTDFAVGYAVLGFIGPPLCIAAVLALGYSVIEPYVTTLSVTLLCIAIFIALMFEKGRGFLIGSWYASLILVCIAAGLLIPGIVCTAAWNAGCIDGEKHYLFTTPEKSAREDASLASYERRMSDPLRHEIKNLAEMARQEEAEAIKAAILNLPEEGYYEGTAIEVLPELRIIMPHVYPPVETPLTPTSQPQVIQVQSPAPEIVPAAPPKRVDKTTKPKKKNAVVKKSTKMKKSAAKKPKKASTKSKPRIKTNQN